MTRYLSPLSGRALHADTSYSLGDGTGERWPVIDGIPYLRVGSEKRASAALECLDAGDQTTAIILLLAENDRWWTEPPPPVDQLRRLVAGRDRLSLREAMELLGWGRVGDYFAHRWSDPTFLAGLTLTDAHWNAPASAFELACGIGHYLRALGKAGVRAVGADLVFAKLWVARHWVAPDAELVCFDADGRWPLTGKFDLACCHDAFYFLTDKPHVAAMLARLSPAVIVSHIHNREHPNLSGGAGMTEAEVRALFPAATLYADEELTAAGSEGRAPRPATNTRTEAFAVALGLPPARAPEHLIAPALGTPLRRNPLCASGAPAWPSARYAEEYAARATFACVAVPDCTAMAPCWADAVRKRELVDLPERW